MDDHPQSLRVLTLYSQIVKRLAADRLIPNTSQTLALVMISEVFQHNQRNEPINKTKLLNLLPKQLGSISRKRYTINALEGLGAINIVQGVKKSEKLLEVTDDVRTILMPKR